MPPFSGPPFALETVTPYTSLTLRVKFTQDPRQVSPAGPTDGLNPSNYSLAGPIVVTITQINTVSTSTQELDVVLAAPLPVGQWTLTVANIVSDVGDPLTNPTSITFDITDISTATPYNAGATNDTEKGILRKHFSSAFKGDAWDALLEALAVGDGYNNDNAQSIFDQLFRATASGIYLDRKASDDGLIRPPGIGMDDDVFRQYDIRHTAEKLTFKSLWELMEVFYGSDSVKSYMITETYEPFTLSDGDDLTILVDETTEINVTFQASDFNVISSATALEISNILNQEFDRHDNKARAIPYTDPETGYTQLKVYSGSLGLRSFIRVTGGKAQNVLQFPSKIDEAFTGSTIAWTISVDELNKVRFTTNSALVNLSYVRVGDFVNLNSLGFTIDGSYPILEVGYSLVSTTQWFVVAADSIPDPSGVWNQTLASEVVFHRPVKNDIFTNDQQNVSIVATSPNDLHIKIPATSQVVSRDVGTAAYMHLNDPFEDVNVYGINESIRLNIGAHNLTTSDRVIVDNFVPSSAVPANTVAATWVPGSLSGTCAANPLRKYNLVHDGGSLEPRSGGVVLPIGTNKLLIAAGADFTLGAPVLSNTCQELTVSNPVAGVVSYQWGDTSVITNGVVNCSGVTLTNSVAFANNVVVIGGMDAGSVAQNTVQAYDPITHNWTNHIEATLSTARYYHNSVLLDDGSIFVCGGLDGAGVATGSCEIVTPNDSGTWVTSAATACPIAHSFVQMVKLVDGKVMVTGGLDATANFLNQCHVYDPATNTWTEYGGMMYGRVWHSMCVLPDGRVIVTGGFGYKWTQVGSGLAPVKITECWDPNTKRWTVLPSTNHNHLQAVLNYNTNDGKVYCVGSDYTESYDFNSKKWQNIVNTTTTTNVSGFSSIVLGENLITATGSDWTTGASVTDVNVLVPGETSLHSQALNGEYDIISTGGTYVNIESPYEGYVQSSASDVNIYVTRELVDNGVPGPYLVDPNDGVSITGTVTTLAQELIAGEKYSKIDVISTADFPDEEGWVCFEYGKENSSGPIKYIGLYSATELIVDYNTPIPSTCAIGGTVTLLSQKGAWDPSDCASLGMLWATASPAGRVSAQDALEASIAAGIGSSIEISYPGDRGLGNEGSAVNGTSKLSDVVAVWAGDDIDTEVEEARDV